MNDKCGDLASKAYLKGACLKCFFIDLLDLFRLHYDDIPSPFINFFMVLSRCSLTDPV